MGVVYVAEDTTLGRHVAIKFLSSTAKEYRARFLREARAVSALTHPNIATVFDYGETNDGQPYIVMELIRGQPLNEKLIEGSLPLPEAVRIVSMIAEALGEAHHQGVIHRDIKPSNVVITERGNVKVLDFGLVKQLNEQLSLGGDPNLPTLPSTRTRSDVIVGTPMYLSPEQATGRKVDTRSDLFALGVVLYECIAGQTPFSGSSIIEIGAQVLHATPPLPSSINDRIPPELDRITMKAIEKKADARYQSAAELIADLQKVLPTLDADGYRKAKATGAVPKPRTYSASALTTISETLRKPGPSLGKLILGGIALAVIVLLLIFLLKPSPYKPSAAAKTWYDKGVAALRDGAFLQATKAFEQAVAEDPKFPLAHARLAEAWYEMDYADKAKDEMLIVQNLVPNRSQLEKTDRLHLEAINATVSHEFAAAINPYKELAALAPNDSQASVDLGRAYEKDDQLKDAIRSYVEASTRAPQYATAFLRVGTLYARQLDQPAALDALNKADTIYQAEGNFEGQAEVAFQRGVLFDLVGKGPEARQQLERSLELARTTNNDYQYVKTLLRLGYAQSTLEDGRKLMEQGVDLAQQKGIDNLIKSGLADIGNTYLAAGKYSEAQDYFTKSLNLARQQHDERNAARALLCLASNAERQTNAEKTLAFINQALPFYQKGGYRKETIQAFALMGRAKLHQGLYSEAMDGYQQVLKLARDLGDGSSTLSAQQDIARLLIIEGKYAEALQPLDESFQIAKSSNIRKDIGLILIDRANVWWRLGHYTEAQAALAEASVIVLRPDAASNLQANYYLALSQMKLSELNWHEAREAAQKAKLVASPTVKFFAINIPLNQGLALTMAGQSQQGVATCGLAVDDARALGDPALLAQSLLALAQAQVEAKDYAGAKANALEAQQLFSAAGRHDYEWLGLLIAARASNATHESDQARDYGTRAQQILAGLQSQWGNDNYNSYLNRPDVQLFRKQLEDLMAGRS